MCDRSFQNMVRKTVFEDLKQQLLKFFELLVRAFLMFEIICLVFSEEM